MYVRFYVEKVKKSPEQCILSPLVMLETPSKPCKFEQGAKLLNDSCYNTWFSVYIWRMMCYRKHLGNSIQGAILNIFFTVSAGSAAPACETRVI